MPERMKMIRWEPEMGKGVLHSVMKFFIYRWFFETFSTDLHKLVVQALMAGVWLSHD